MKNILIANLIYFRWRRSNRSRLCEGSKSVRSCVGRLSVWPRRFRCSWADFSEGFVFGAGTGRSPIQSVRIVIAWCCVTFIILLFSLQIYPQTQNERPLTRLQERLIKKLGAHAFPFYFEVPPHCPASVSLQPAPGDTGKPCGVDYELKAFVGEHIDDKPHKRNSVRLAIRKIMYAPSKLGEQPSIEVSKEFMLKPNKIHLEASLDKEVGLFRTFFYTIIPNPLFFLDSFMTVIPSRRNDFGQCTRCQ